MTEYKDLADSLNREKDLIPRARRIFNNLSAIESILTRGITVNSLAIMLGNNGFEITFEQLKNGIYQARKKRKKQGSIQEDIKPIVNTVETTAISAEPAKEEKHAIKRKLTPAEEAQEEMKRLKEFKQSKK